VFVNSSPSMPALRPDERGLRWSRWIRAGFWLALYGALVLAPLALLFAAPLPPFRGFLFEFAAALGFIALAMLLLQFPLSARFRHIAPFFGADTLLQFHRQAAFVATAIVGVHVLFMLAADPRHLDFLDPRVNPLRATFLVGVMVALVLLIVLTLWHEEIGLKYEWWRLTHAVLAVGVVVIGLTHALQVGRYAAAPWYRALWIGLAVATLATLVEVRLLRPLRMRRRPYRVVDVRPERDNTWTLTLRADGHAGVRFLPGQFAWIILGQSPFSIEQHPFSFVSSADDPRPAFAIKETGDFTARIQNVAPGTVAYLDAPHGAFSIDLFDAGGAVFLAGGIGVAPILCMLRTLAARGDTRPLVLLYGNPNWEAIAFREELEALRQSLRLEVIHVLSEPPPGWTGPSGYINPEVLDRYLPPDPSGKFHFFLCGPPPMMDAVEPMLLARGIPRARIHSERFHLA
jgi:predicted ferric reductase